MRSLAIPFLLASFATLAAPSSAQSIDYVKCEAMARARERVLENRFLVLEAQLAMASALTRDAEIRAIPEMYQ